MGINFRLQGSHKNVGRNIVIARINPIQIVQESMCNYKNIAINYCGYEQVKKLHKVPYISYIHFIKTVYIKAFKTHFNTYA
jgi:hypothetical protein